MGTSDTAAVRRQGQWRWRVVPDIVIHRLLKQKLVFAIIVLLVRRECCADRWRRRAMICANTGVACCVCLSCVIAGRSRFGLIRFGSVIFEKSSFRFGSVRCGNCFSGSMRFGRFGSVSCSFLQLSSCAARQPRLWSTSISRRCGASVPGPCLALTDNDGQL